MPRPQCLARPDLLVAAREGIILSDSFDEDQFQPSSFEPRLSSEAYAIDPSQGIFRPSARYDVRSLLQHHQGRVIPLTFHTRLELKRGFTYLIRLRERVNLPGGWWIRHSPKSSLGRLFVHTRLIADGNAAYDEITGQGEKSLWMLIQPLAFNILVTPDARLGQLRFMTGSAAKMSNQEISRRLRKEPILTRKDGTRVEEVHDGVRVHLWLGRREQITIFQDEFYLLSSEEIFNTPPDMNIELHMYSHLSLTGELHYAGFIDNGFRGDLVFEVHPRETIILTNHMPLSTLSFYHTTPPDHVYGEDVLGSHYQDQQGPRVPKFFKPLEDNRIIALRARPNPEPIDISRKHAYDPLEYYEPVYDEE